jgi:hypothetical protein
MKPETTITNAVEEAIYGVLGGPEKAHKALGMSRPMVYIWLGQRMIRNRETALHVEMITAKRGTRIPAAELMALVSWTGPTRGNGKRVPRDSRCMAPVAATEAVANANNATSPAAVLRRAA